MTEQLYCSQCKIRYIGLGPDYGPCFKPWSRRPLCPSCEEELGNLMMEAAPVLGHVYEPQID